MLTAIKRYNVDSMGLMTIAGTETFSHDAMGNPTSYALKTLTWSGKQLIRYYYQPGKNQLYNYTYAYDENGLRTQKVLNGVTTSYYYNGSVLMGMVTGSGNSAIHQLFSYDSSGNVVSVDYSSNGGSIFTTYYYLRNAQNDIVKIIDGSGNTVVQYTYDSWGKPISTTGSLSATLGANQPFRYRGYVYDAETGWYYLQSRYYDPSIGRFISADVLLSTGQGVIGHNSYAYCGNNPIARTDSTGYAWWHWVIAAAVVAVAAVAVVATAGGAAAAVCAVTMVANGAAAATTASTVAAGVFIGSSVGFAAATMSSIATSGSVEDFMDNGDWYTVAGTMTGGLLGGVNAYNLRPRNYPRVVPYAQGTSQAPKSDPNLANGYYDKVSNDGTVLSTAYYNALGRQCMRYDFYGRPHGGVLPHIHLFGYNDKGQVIGKFVYDMRWNRLK